MDEKSRYDWQELRVWRVIGIVSLIFIPIWPIAMVILRELHDVSISGHYVIGLPILLVSAAARKITGFECPECHRSFASNERTGTHLTNKRCANCGLAVGT